METHYVGIDISKDSFDVCLCNSGKIVCRKFSYTEEGMEDFLGILGADSHCIMESTGVYHTRLSYYLYENKIKVSVLNPLVVKRYAQSLLVRTKTDKKDCQLLQKYGIMHQPDPWEPTPGHYVELQQMVNLQEQLLKQQTSYCNQLESINYSVKKNQLVISLLREQLEQIKKNLEQLEKEMETIIRRHDNDKFDKLMSIPGIGKKTAIVFLSVTQGLSNFSSAKQLSSYFGLAPRIYESGSSIKGRAKICKMGMGLIRKLLYMCAWSACRFNHACHILYNRLVEAGKSKKLALIAVANKLIKQAFAVIKNNTIFDNFLILKFAD